MPTVKRRGGLLQLLAESIQTALCVVKYFQRMLVLTNPWCCCGLTAGGRRLDGSGLAEALAAAPPRCCGGSAMAGRLRGCYGWIVCCHGNRVGGSMQALRVVCRCQPVAPAQLRWCCRSASCLWCWLNCGGAAGALPVSGAGRLNCGGAAGAQACGSHLVAHGGEHASRNKAWQDHQTLQGRTYAPVSGTGAASNAPPLAPAGRRKEDYVQSTTSALTRLPR